MLIGRVVELDQGKGIGKILTVHDGSYFLDIHDFDENSGEIKIGTTVIFERYFNHNKKTAEAIECRRLNKPDDFQLIMQYFGCRDTIEHEIVVEGFGKKGNPYKRRETKSYSLLTSASSQLMRCSSDETIKHFFCKYFDSGGLKNKVVEYAQFIKARIQKNIPLERQAEMLSHIFRHFGQNVDDSIIFRIWKTKQFEFIDYRFTEQNHPPIELLAKFPAEIELSELQRISAYAGGQEFCETFCVEKLNSCTAGKIEDLKQLYKLLQFISEDKREKYQWNLEQLLTRSTIKEIVSKGSLLGNIHTKAELKAFENLKNLIPVELRADNLALVRDELKQLIQRHSSKESTALLWINGYAEVPAWVVVESFFFSGTTEEQVSVLRNLPTENQFRLLQELCNRKLTSQAFVLVYRYFNLINICQNDNEIKEQLFNEDYLLKQPDHNLALLWKRHVEQLFTDEEKAELFLSGQYPFISKEMALLFISKFNDVHFKKVIEFHRSDNQFLLSFFVEMVRMNDKRSLLRILGLAKNYLGKDEFELFDHHLFDTLTADHYYDLWADGKVFIFPRQYVQYLIDQQGDFLMTFADVFNRHDFKDNVQQMLIAYLEKEEPVTDRLIFSKIYSYIDYYLQINSENLHNLKAFNNPVYDSIAFEKNYSNDFSFDQLASKFIYFTPYQQVRIIKRLFSLKATRQFDYSLSDLNKLTRADEDLFTISSRYHENFILDISTQVIISTLINFRDNRKFLAKATLLRLALQNIGPDHKYRFQLGEYFEQCEGRMLAKKSEDANGTIKKQFINENDYFFIVRFKFDRYLVEQIRNIVGRQWHPHGEYWSVPANQLDSLVEFGIENRFLFEFEIENETHNRQLLDLERGDRPEGISYCEGRPALMPDRNFGVSFWWCANRICYQNCQTAHSPDQWESYTLLDFCDILGFNTDSVDRVGNVVPKGSYNEFISLVNQFNILLDRLYCNNCNEILFPVDTSYFAAHNVVRFCCENVNCISYKTEIYLNHCLNGKCRNIVDSRVSKRCPHGLVICDKCGSCCSHAMFSRRAQNLTITTGHISQILQNQVAERLGHLERSEYYCYRCGEEMLENITDVFKCHHCDITYDTTPYKFERININLRRANFGRRNS